MNSEIKKVIAQRILRYNSNQTEIVKHLIRNGYSESQIKDEIEQVFPSIHKSLITKSLPFLFLCVTLFLISLCPLIGYFFDNSIYYGLLSLFLMIITFGYFKIKRISIIIWIVLITLFFIYVLLVLMAKISGHNINSLYSYTSMITVLLFLSSILGALIYIYSMNEKFRKQHKFE